MLIVVFEIGGIEMLQCERFFAVTQGIEAQIEMALGIQGTKSFYM